MTPLSPLERRILSSLGSRWQSSEFAWSVDEVAVYNRDPTVVGLLCDLRIPGSASVIAIGARLRRISLVIKHADLPLDGCGVVELDELGTPVALEYLSFDGSPWPHDAPHQSFSIFDEMGETCLSPGAMS
jgi:hypothetical protein